MPQSRFDWHERIKAVEREFWTARLAIDRLSEAAARNPEVLVVNPRPRGHQGTGVDPGGGTRRATFSVIRPRDLEAVDDNLEGTYLVRMFAEFETALRSYWRAIRPGSRPAVEVLLNRVGASRAIPGDLVQDAHAVRTYRNTLVHERDREAEPVTIGEARQHLATYFARLPDEWGG